MPPRKRSQPKPQLQSLPQSPPNRQGWDPKDPTQTLGQQMGQLTHTMAQWLDCFDPAQLSAEALSAEILSFFACLRTQLQRSGEYAYMARRMALFLVESLSLRLRHGRTEHEVPVEHAAIFDTSYNKIQSTKSGIVGEVDVERLTTALDRDFRSYAAKALQEVGFSARIPHTALVNEKKILVN